MNYNDKNNTIKNNALVKIYDGIKHTDISQEFILPDYLPDIKKIIRVDTIQKIDGKYVSSGKVDYDGDVVCNILYCDEGNHLRAVTFTIAFSDGVDIGKVQDECVANILTEPDSLICKMMNPRRVTIRMRLDTAVTVWCDQSFEPQLSGQYTPSKIERKESSVEVMKLVCAGESGLNVSVDLEADGALPQIGEIISCNVDMSFYDCKGADNKVLCRGEMPVTVFYSSQNQESETYTVLYRRIPIAQVVLTQGIEDDYSCMARGAIENVTYNVSENGFGERRIVELDVTYKIYLNCVGKDIVSVVNDIYSVDKAVNAELQAQTFCNMSRLFCTTFSANLALSREEVNMKNADSVFAIKSLPKITSVTLDSQRNMLNINGVAKNSVIVKNNDELNTYEYDLPFSTELDGSGLPDEFIYNYDIVCMGSKGRFDSENFYTELDLSLNLMILEAKTVQVLKNAEFSDQVEAEQRPQMRFYYPDPNESLWEIGKRFGVPINAVVSQNMISDDKLPEVMFIPGVK